ncbi:MAG: PTS sugar transporter subunit IIA [Spirochaetaceae bacterium]|nr:PTS sugar transporter subunit IIA [Spirochaetaceae bacterium]
MLLQDIFSAARIKAGLEAEDKEELFEELADVLVRGYGIADRDGVLAAVREREAKMSTGIKTGIAIPHGKTECVSGICGVLGISRGGIDYEALDGKPVHFVIFLVCSPKDTELHLKTLHKIAGILKCPGFYEEMREADSAEKAHEVLRRYEDMLEKSKD